MNESLEFLIKNVGLDFPKGFPNPTIRNISFNSKNINEGTLFIGLPGENIDGGIFWEEALEKGAEAAIIGKKAAKLFPPQTSDAVVVLPDPVSKWAGEILSLFWDKPSNNLQLVGVTGTNGKTTITHLIDFFCSSIGLPSALFGTLVNKWPGYEETATHTTTSSDILHENLYRANKSGAKIVAMEVSSHALAQYRVSGCNFAVSVFSNLSQDHLDYHDSMEDYFLSKFRLFQKPLFSGEKAKAIINVDNEWGLRLANILGESCWRCSLNETLIETNRVDLFVDNVRISARGLHGIFHSPNGTGNFVSPLIGEFNLMNTIQAIGSLLQLGIPLDDMLNSLAKFPGVSGRMEQLRLEKSDYLCDIPTVIVDYAHTPDALKNVLRELRRLTTGKIICVFGCGGDRDRGKREQMGEIAAALSDSLIITSDNPRSEDPLKIIKDISNGIPTGSNFSIEPDRNTAIKIAIMRAQIDDFILIAGKGHETYQVVKNRTLFFDDRQAALNALRARAKKG